MGTIKFEISPKYSDLGTTNLFNMFAIIKITENCQLANTVKLFCESMLILKFNNSCDELTIKVFFMNQKNEINLKMKSKSQDRFR